MACTSMNFLKELVTPNNPNLDIVAVHGLNPINKESHAEATWTAGGKLWLRDFLPSRLPNARVLLFGYNSNVAFQTSTAGVREQAVNLLNRLVSERRNAPDRPIIFVCHSLGGIIVKQALVESKINESYNVIGCATYGIAFFGTPHGGSGLAKFGNFAAATTRMVLQNPQNTFMRFLKRKSSFSDILVGDFRHQLEDYYILSFYETLPLKKFGLIVDQKSATLGLPGSREKQLSIEADHKNICKFETADGGEYKKVIENLATLADQATKQPGPSATTNLAVSILEGNSSSAASGPAFIMPYTKNPDFTGRTQILETLKDILPARKQKGKEQVQARGALFGLGGIGKTQIAIEYAYWLHNECPDRSIFWIRGNNIEVFLQSVDKIARECKIPGADDPKVDQAALFKTWLEGKNCGEWLVIVDNADDAELFFTSRKRTIGSGLASYIPECSHGSILVTTRDKVVASKFTKGRRRDLIEVTKMSEIESTDLIKQKIHQEIITETEIFDLATILDHLPLALAQAAAYIQEKSITVNEYLALYNSSDDTKTDLLSEPFETMGRDSEVPNAVAITWKISFDQIKERSPLASEILSLMAFFNWQGIPKSLLQQQSDNALDLTNALGILKAFSLLTAGSGDTFDVHRLVQLVIRKWLVISGEFKLWAEKALGLMADLFPEDVDDFENWTTCAIYLPHAQATLQYDSGSAEPRQKTNLLSRVGSSLHLQGRWNEAESLIVQAVEISKEVLGDDDCDTLRCIHDLAIIFCNLGRLKEAEELLAGVRDKRIKLLGMDHTYTLITMEHLSSVMENQGRYKEAEDLIIQVIDKRKMLFGDENLDVQFCLQHLANIIEKQGRWQEAENLLVQVVAAVKEAKGDGHPDTIRSRHNLAMAYIMNDRWNEAEELYVDIIEKGKRIFGIDHPNTLTSMGNLGHTLHEQGRLEEAEKLLIQVGESLKRVLGVEHPQTLSILATLAAVYARQERFKESEDLEIYVLDSRKKVLGIKHPSTLNAMSDLAIIYSRQSRFREAEKLEVFVVDTSKKVLGIEHPDTLTAMRNLAATYYKQDCFEEAEELEIAVVEGRNGVLGIKHPETLEAMGDLALIYKAQSRLEEAEDLEAQITELKQEHGSKECC